MMPALKTAIADQLDELIFGNNGYSCLATILTADYGNKENIGVRVSYIEKAITIQDPNAFASFLDSLYRRDATLGKDNLNIVRALKTINDVCFNNEVKDRVYGVKRAISLYFGKIASLTNPSIVSTIQVTTKITIREKLTQLLGDPQIAKQKKDEEANISSSEQNKDWRIRLDLPSAQLVGLDLSQIPRELQNYDISETEYRSFAFEIRQMIDHDSSALIAILDMVQWNLSQFAELNLSQITKIITFVGNFDCGYIKEMTEREKITLAELANLGLDKLKLINATGCSVATVNGLSSEQVTKLFNFDLSRIRPVLEREKVTYGIEEKVTLVKLANFDLDRFKLVSWVGDCSVAVVNELSSTQVTKLLSIGECNIMKILMSENINYATEEKVAFAKLANFDLNKLRLIVNINYCSIAEVDKLSSEQAIKMNTFVDIDVYNALKRENITLVKLASFDLNRMNLIIAGRCHIAEVNGLSSKQVENLNIALGRGIKNVLEREKISLVEFANFGLCQIRLLSEGLSIEEVNRLSNNRLLELFKYSCASDSRCLFEDMGVKFSDIANLPEDKFKFMTNADYIPKICKLLKDAYSYTETEVSRSMMFMFNKLASLNIDDLTQVLLDIDSEKSQKMLEALFGPNKMDSSFFPTAVRPK